MHSRLNIDQSDLLHSPHPLEWPLLGGGLGTDRDSALWLCVDGIPMRDRHPLTLHYIPLFVARRYSIHRVHCLFFVPFEGFLMCSHW